VTRGRSIRIGSIGACIALAACAGVLGLRRTAPGSFPHRAHVVAGVSCTRCHTGLDAPGTSLHLPTDEHCTGCHTKPHDTRSCEGCHVSKTAVAELVEARDHLRFDHRRHISVANGNCMRCHDGVASGATRLRPPMATCFRCHDDMRDARRCDACHENLAEEGTLPASHLAHDGDWIREHGTRASSSGDLCETCHKQSYCASCHGQTVPALPSSTRFADPFRASVHRAGFVARHALEARSDPGACSTCHTPDRCSSCHAAKGIAGDARGNPHPPGWVGLTSAENRHGREARRDPAGCASCHGGAGEKLCVTCHAVGGVGGNPHPPGWSSRQPLSAMPCRMCHPIGAARR
jgi:predicted CXXCH cytochrome family protein